jgi:periplasmic divalent cation tolerance protein
MPQDRPDLIICLSTVATPDDARRLAGRILDQSAAACVQIDGPIESHYVWQGERNRDQEYRLMIKTSSDAWPRLKQLLIESHPYDEPQVISVPVHDAAEGYGRWVIAQTT